MLRTWQAINQDFAKIHKLLGFRNTSQTEASFYYPYYFKKKIQMFTVAYAKRTGNTIDRDTKRKIQTVNVVIIKTPRFINPIDLFYLFFTIHIATAF